MSGITGQQTLLVTAAPLESIAVTPADPTTPVLTKEPFKATGTYTDGHTEDLTKMVLWTSSDETIATISNAYPDPGAASALADGKTEIKAELAGITGVTELTVVAATLESIAVTPADQTVPLGIDEQFTATGTYDNGHTEDLTKNVTWSSSDKTIATISNASPTEGLATGHAEGKTTITATLGGLSGNTGLTVTTAVLVSIDVTPKDQEIGRGKSLQFTATGTFSDSTTEDLTNSVTWKSSAWLKIKISNAEGSRGLAHVGLLAIPGKSTISATSSPETGSIKGETEATAKLL